MEIGITDKQKKKILDTLFYICQHPDEWRQDSWGFAKGEPVSTPKDLTPACGTSFCFAGHVALNNGYKPEWRRLSGSTDADGLPQFTMHYVTSPDGNTEDTANAAREVLGLPEPIVDVLFDAANSLDDLIDMVIAIMDDAWPETISSYYTSTFNGSRSQVLRELNTRADTHNAVRIKTMCKILRNPSEWDQTYWGKKVEGANAPACGTAFCFAGHAAVSVGGGTPIWNDFNEFQWVTTPKGERESVAAYANKVLGLGESGPRHSLFYGENKLETLIKGVKSLVVKGRLPKDLL